MGHEVPCQLIRGVFKRSFRAIAIRFLLAFAKPFFFRGIFSAPYSFMRISHLHGF
jgi:hypothetical protein